MSHDAHHSVRKATLRRIAVTMSGFGIVVFPGDKDFVATANLNGFRVTFACLPSTIVVRADHSTHIESSTDIPTLHLAANQVNCASYAVRAAVDNTGPTLVVRTEREIPVAAGISDIQLKAALKDAVDDVIAGQDAVGAAAQQLLDAKGGGH